MQNARKLVVYRESRELAIAVYRLTADYPVSERFGLTQQLRRGAVSVGSNIAEGCGQKGSRAFTPYLHHAIGSANEVEFQLEIAAALGFGSKQQTQSVLTMLVRTRRQLIKLAATVAKRSARSVKSSPTTQDPPPTTPNSSPGPSLATHAAAYSTPSP
jgi:four helix bundle protein